MDLNCWEKKTRLTNLFCKFVDCKLLFNRHIIQQQIQLNKLSQIAQNKVYQHLLTPDQMEDTDIPQN